MARTPRLSLDLLRGFRAAARHLSFTRAASELFVTQSAISHEIRILEEQLGQPLFLRVNRALQLTPAGQDLYRAADEALAVVDAAVERLAGAGTILAVTTTPALASTWLAPRLQGFIRRHPDIDVRLAATNDTVNLERENVDLAIRYVPPGWDIPGGLRLFDYEIFPVCAPALAREAARPLRSVADLARHARLDFDVILYGRPWRDWEQWFGAMKIRRIKPAGMLLFSHYDQVIQAAVEGSGIAIGKLPHLTRQLREGVLCAPLGADHAVGLGGFDVVVGARAAGRADVDAFIAWIREEAQRDLGEAPGLGIGHGKAGADTGTPRGRPGRGRR